MSAFGPCPLLPRVEPVIPEPQVIELTYYHPVRLKLRQWLLIADCRPMKLEFACAERSEEPRLLARRQPA
ncbi:hypothetical protein SRIMHP_03040 [Streptomyces rimosus subsp. rimosus]|uniref:Uncharacterized protein n=1 Tax=Streptomyces rimosus subsp. rimosus TaxID=132474 RepID=A0ABY3YT47_STRRM|nr:hypothetical protein SRIMR7_03045 [Streptomyces rimosus subsp. rimosus]UTH93089.1 hypothetical protein SRIMHP_03040 [Streptomyces rimosus subsp. rimosus]UTJ11185.1 hypothetical protein SRIMDV3_02940 [Streptomyces rimosus subsp. rimosus]